MEYKVSLIAQLLNGEVEGDAEMAITGVSKIEEGVPGTLTFLANPKYTEYIYTTKASAVIVSKDFIPTNSISPTLIRVQDPYGAIAALLRFYESLKGRKIGREDPVFVAPDAVLGKDLYLGAFAYIGKGVKVGDGTSIYPQAYIGDNVTIGNNVIIYPGVKIYHDCVIGNNCIIHAGAVIGSDGFGFAPDASGVFQKIPQTGNVVLNDDVEIGANTCIDRATMGSTVISKGVKLDNLIQVAHNVVIGENTVMAAQSGIAGSTKVGSACMIGGQVGIVGHISVANGTKMGAKTGIMGAVKEPNKELFGHPSMDHRVAIRSYVCLKNLPQMEKRLRDIEQKLNNK